MGEDTFEVERNGDFAINGISGIDLPFTLGDSKAVVTHDSPNKNQHKFNVTLPDGQQIFLGSWKDLVFVKLGKSASQPKHFKDSLGLLGSYADNGAMIARDGKTLMTKDPNGFGSEWQVRSDDPKLFRSAQGPQYPEQCVMPSVAQADRRRRLGEGLAENAAKEACAHWGDADKVANCVFDTMATGDLDLAEAGPF